MQTKQKEKQSDNHYLSSLDFESQKKNYHKRLKLHHIKAQQLNVPMQGKGQIKIYLNILTSCLPNSEIWPDNKLPMLFPKQRILTTLFYS